MDLEDAMVAWDPAAERVTVGYARGDWAADYPHSAGACDADFNAADEDGKLARLFAAVTKMTVTHGIPPEVVHEALMTIDEYRSRIAGEDPSDTD